ncbi:MAG: hypothetical protein E7616_04645 [Ruminococcaceae bacterium]|nr:hypothetical protein [Oscillospiraceae bacterium]
MIVVTHNFEQLAACATRHIRIFDGAVESDHVLIPAKTEGESVNKATEKTVKKNKAGFSKGFTLGRTIFTAKPKLSFFLCLLMIIGTLGIFMVTTLCGDAAMLFKKNYMFEPIDGRVVITKQNGEVITEEELQELAKTCQAQNVLHYDILLDESYGIALGYYNAAKDLYEYINCQFTYNEDFGKDIVGTYPKEVNEVFLYLPISYQPTFGKDTVKIKEININSTTWQVSGVQYYYDNNQTARCLFTEDGFRVATAIYYLLNRGNLNIDVQLKNDAGNTVNAMQFYEFTPSFAVEEGKIYLGSKEYQAYAKDNNKTEIYFTSTYMNYNYNYADSVKTYLFSQTFTDEDLTKTAPNVDDSQFYINKNVMIHPMMLLDFTEEVLGRAYKQASLFFADNEAAHAAAEKISTLSYVAVPADTTYSPDAVTAIASILASLMLALVWLMGIVFLAFFINLCSARTLDAFKGDMAIMRSMGISVKTIRIGMYVRMLFSLVPAFIMLIVTAFLIFTTPTFNAYFVYLYPWQYAVIILGMLYLTVRITHKQIRRLFGESVKKALKGGSAA